jgi:uncharacterized protein
MIRLSLATTAFAATVLTFATAPVSAASFNCGRHLTHTEAAICDNANLSDLDSRMASLYYTRLHQLHGSSRAGLQADQVDWLASRNSCGADVDCLTNAYTSRIHIMMVTY